MFQRYHKRPEVEAGQGLVEYALILVLVAIAVIIALTTMGDRFSSMFEYIFLSIEYSSVESLIEHCLEAEGNAAVAALQNEAATDPAAFETSVENYYDVGTIEAACRNRMLDFAD